MSGVSDARPGDIYVDEHGKLWRCIAYCGQPTVTFEEVEGHTVATPMYAANQAAGQMGMQAAPPILKARQSGGITGLMFEGWKRIWRKDDIKPQEKAA